MPQPNTDRDSDGNTYSYGDADSKRYAYSYCGAEVYAVAPAARHASSTPISSSLVG